MDVAGAQLMRTRVGQFLNSRARGRADLRNALTMLEEAGDGAYLFGGFLRDLAIAGAFAIPRDIDVVVRAESLSAVQRHFQDSIRRRTRFGGLQILYKQWRIDVWPLCDTWAFQERLVSAALDHLPRTTFLNTEALAVAAVAQPGRPRWIAECGFFEAMRERVLDINLEENPFPELCVIRALLTAAKLNYELAPKLISYIVQHTKVGDIRPLLQAQVAHYGVARRLTHDVERWIWLLHKHYDATPDASCRLSGEDRQTAFWDESEVVDAVATLLAHG